MTIPKIEETLTGMGICIKDNDFRVLSQNKKCQDLCGDKLGLICNDGCYKQQSPKNTGEKIFKTRPFSTNTEMIECVIIKNEGFITTLQMPTDHRIENIITTALKYRLTPTELVILKDKLTKYSIQQIADRLFISKSTVKTHLNNIYAKIPDDLKSIILGEPTPPNTSPDI